MLFGSGLHITLKPFFSTRNISLRAFSNILAHGTIKFLAVPERSGNRYGNFHCKIHYFQYYDSIVIGLFDGRQWPSMILGWWVWGWGVGGGGGTPPSV